MSLTKTILLFFAVGFLTTSCIRHSEISREIDFSLPPKNMECVVLKTNKPNKEAIRIAYISIDGTAYSDKQDLDKAAKKKAADIGGDFIMTESRSAKVVPMDSVVHQFPSANYSVWVYTPAQLGIRLDNKSTIIGFHLNSDAFEAGICPQDTLIGIDGLDLNDENLNHHLMKIQPGDKVVLNIIQNNNRFDKIITALPN